MDEVTINITEIPDEVTIIASEPNSLPVSTAVSDFLTGTVAGTWVVKTLEQIKAILGLGSIASKDFWSGTDAQYAALGTWDDNTLYFTTE